MMNLHISLGAADFNGTRMNAITAGQYFTHIMKYKDGRFA